jgi:hypothetical protein
MTLGQSCEVRQQRQKEKEEDGLLAGAKTTSGVEAKKIGSFKRGL